MLYMPEVPRYDLRVIDDLKKDILHIANVQPHVLDTRQYVNIFQARNTGLRLIIEFLEENRQYSPQLFRHVFARQINDGVMSDDLIERYRRIVSMTDKNKDDT